MTGRVKGRRSRWGIVAAASVALGMLLSRWEVPAAWIIAGILASGAMALATGEDLPVHPHVHRFGRGIIGILAGAPLVGLSLPTLAPLILPGLFVAAVTMGIGIGGGLLLARRTPEVSPETGVLSMLAGGASILPVLAQDLGADHRFVALAQYLRLLAVSMTLPFVAAFLPHPGHAGTAAEGPWFTVLAVIAVAVVGGPLGRVLRVPAPNIFGPLLLTVAIGLLTDWSLQPPELFRIVAFLAIGWICGGALSLPALRLFARQLPVTLTFIAVVMAACAATAVPLAWWLDITYFEAYLATSPGALETVLALSAEGGAGPSVVAIQLLRTITMLSVAAVVPRLLRR